MAYYLIVLQVFVRFQLTWGKLGNVGTCSFEFAFLFIFTILNFGHINTKRDHGARKNRLDGKTHTGAASRWYLTTIIIYEQEDEIERGLYHRKDI